MLSDAARFPEPALWQGIMFCLLPVWLWLATRNGGKHFSKVTIAYVIGGVVLAAAMIAL